MERLTKKGLADANGRQIVLCNHKEEDCNDSCMYRRCKWNEKVLKKLKEYEDLEEQGMLIKLPCKVGDKVWTKYGCSFEVEKVEIIKGGKIFRCGNQGTSDYMAFYEHEIGTYVFTTKAEAEAAQERMGAEHIISKKADNGSRTRLSGLGSQRSTDEPYLHESIIAPSK